MLETHVALRQKAFISSWVAATRPQFLLASLTCVLVGVSFAAYRGYPFRMGDLLLSIVGAECAHIAVHALNDHSDYQSGIDARTRRTPVSGGTGLLTSGRLKPVHMYWLGVLSSLAVVAIGIRFVMSMGLQTLPLGLLGIAVIWSYTGYLARHGLGELAVGLGFGIWSTGAYYVQARSYSLDIIAVSALPAMTGALLLLLNEFPDVEADRWGGRRNLPITRGLRFASRVHALLALSMFGWLSLLIGLGILPRSCYLAFLALPTALALLVLVRRSHGDILESMNALRLNVLFSLAFPLLISLGMIIAKPT